MSCTLIIYGSTTAIKLFLENSDITPDNVYETHFVLLPSNGDLDDFEGQIQDVTSYLRKNGAEIQDLIARFGLECGRLDFALAQSDEYVQSDVLPAELLFLAGGLGLDIQLSRYPVSDDNE